MILNTPDKPFPATLDIDSSLAANSDSNVASQRAVKSYVDHFNPFDQTLNTSDTPSFAGIKPGVIQDNSGAYFVDVGAKRIYNADGIAIDFSGSSISFANTPFMVVLPTSDPLVAGQLWNNSGVVMVSAG